MGHESRLTSFGIIATFSILSSVTADAAGVLQSIRQNGIIKIGYRRDASPFSFKNEIGEPAGHRRSSLQQASLGLGWAQRPWA
jgi:hypothetical protein